MKYDFKKLEELGWAAAVAAAVFLPLAHYMPEDAFNSWGWRLAESIVAFEMQTSLTKAKQSTFGK